LNDSTGIEAIIIMRMEISSRQWANLSKKGLWGDRNATPANSASQEDSKSPRPLQDGRVRRPQTFFGNLFI
jgi:hypothetical protein